MAVLARGQITITDMRNEGTYTFVRYSDDGGKTFTAAKAWEETRDYGAGVNLVTDADAALSGLAFYQPSGTVTASTANHLKKFTVSPADVEKELVSQYTVTIPEDSTYTESLFVQTDYALTGARISFYTDVHHRVDCEVNKIYNGQYVISAKYELKAGDRLRLPDVFLFTDSATAGTYVSAGYPSLVKEGEHIKGRNLFTNAMLNHFGSPHSGWLDGQAVMTTIEDGVLTINPKADNLTRFGYYKNTYGIGHFDDIPIGAEYVLSVYAKADAPVKWMVSSIGVFIERDPIGNISSEDIGTEWQRYTIHCRNTCQTWKCLILYFIGSAKVYLKDFMLTIGNDIYPYAPAPEDQQFGLTPGKYLGVAVSEKPYPPMNVEDYSWSEIKGTDGKGIASVVRYFGLSNSDAMEPKTYDTTPKSPTPTARYLWGYDLVTYTDGTAVQMPHQVIAVHGDKGKDGTDAVNIIPDPAQIIVDTNDKGLVTNTDGAKSVIRAYRGGTQVTCAASVKVTSAGIGATAILINDNGITTPQISISIAKDPDTGYAYASGYVDLDVVADGKTYKTRLTVGTNIHKVTANLVKKTNEIGVEVGGVRKDFDGYKTQTDTKFSVTDGLIANTVSKDTFNENNNRINTEFTKIKQTADSISLTVQNGTRPNLLWGSDLNLDGVDTTDKAAIQKHLGVGLKNNLKMDDAHFSYLHGQGIDGSDALYFKNDFAAGVEYPGLYWEKAIGAVRNLKLKRNTKYTVSAWIKFAPPQDGQLGFYNCEAFAKNSETDAERVARYDVEGQYQSGSVSQWKRVVFKFTTGEYDYAAVNILTSGKSICELWICRPKLEEGDTATPWCEYDGTEEGLRRTGIDIKTGEITLDAKNTIVKENLTTKRLLTKPTYDGGPYAEIYGSEFLIMYGDGKKGAQFGIGDDGLLHLIFFDADGKAVGDFGPGGWSKLVDATKEEKWSTLFLKNITGSKNINDVINVFQQDTTAYYEFTAARNSELQIVGSNAEYDKQVFLQQNNFTQKIPDGWYIKPNNGSYLQKLLPGSDGDQTKIVYRVYYFPYRNGKMRYGDYVYFRKNASGQYYRTDSDGNDMSGLDLEIYLEPLQF